MYSTPKQKAALAMILAVMILAACGKSADKTNTQVAAKVNKDEISVHQINFLLSRAGQIPQEQLKPASRQALERLIDQELMVQKATESKLDRDPAIMQSLEASRHQILAQAYMNKVMGAASKPTDAEVRDYYDKHPELFSQRRVFRFQQLSIAGGKELVPEIQQMLSANKSMNDLVSWAKVKNLRYTTNAVVKPAEQLPLELLPRLNQMKDGNIGLINENGGISIIQLLASQDQPVDEKAAGSMIQQFLLNKQKTQIADNEVKQLRSTAKIEYMGEFAKKEDEKPAAPATTPAPAKADNAKAAESISKGISGLK